MLTIPIERITVILDRASDVEPADVIASEVAAEFEDTDDVGTDETFASAPARRSLIETLERLTPDEIYELLALAEMARLDSSAGSWRSAVQRAQEISAADAIARLVRLLVLSDAIEVGLDKLGYDLTGDRDAEAEDGDVGDDSEVESKSSH